MHSRHLLEFMRRKEFASMYLRRTAALAAIATIILVWLPAESGAQRPDSARAATTLILPPTPSPESLTPPIGPRRAFLYSALAPGYGQSILGRHKAAAAFMLVEAISIVMIRESAADVHEAKRFENDSLVLAYTSPSGSAVTRQTAPGEFGNAEVKTRRAHVEDWAALLVANHLFSGADAFVAAHLWDVPVRLGLRPTANGTALAASFSVK
jgi:hypothetical protein